MSATVIHLHATRGQKPRPKIVCKDGFSVSIQAGYGIYSTPRDEVPANEYTAVELGFPSAVPPDYILEHAESPDEPTETVYPYVSIELTDRMIAEHGGTA